MGRAEQLCTGFWARTKTVVFFFIAYVVSVIIMALIVHGVTAADIFAAQVFVDAKKQFLSEYLANGSKAGYLAGLLWDFPYMAAYGGLLVSLIVALSCRAAIKVTTLTVFLLFPLIAVGADVFENILEVIIVYKFPDISDGFLEFAAIISWIKWLNVFVSAAIIIYLFVRRLFTRL